MKKNWINSFTIAIGLTLASLYIYTLNLPFFHLLELKSYDFKVRARGERPITDQVVIVAVDEKSLKEKGRWPWPRTYMADLVDKISGAGAAVIGFDILFPEPDSYIPFQAVQEAVPPRGVRAGARAGRHEGASRVERLSNIDFLIDCKCVKKN